MTPNYSSKMTRKYIFSGPETPGVPKNSNRQKTTTMGAAHSTINPSLEWVVVRDLYRYFNQSIPVDSFPCYLVRKKPGQIRFYLRCLKNGRVKKQLIMYCKEKSNGNFRVYKAGSRSPIGYIKKGRYSYKVLDQSRGYCAKIQVRRQSCGVYDKITTKMVISGHRLVFVSTRHAYAKPTTHKERRLDCLAPCSLLQAFCFGILAQ